MNYGLHLSLKMEKHLEALLAQQKQQQENNRSSGTRRISTSTNAEHNGTNEDGTLPVHYGIQYQNRDGDESVVWGNAAAGGGGAGAVGLAGLGDEDLEEKALGMAIEEVWEESGRRWRPWAANGRATRIGEIVLIVDSDTVVPEDCLRDAAREMRACPTVAIIQHESGGFSYWAFFFFFFQLTTSVLGVDVMQVAHHYFENGIAYFTKRINRCISICELSL
jgi:hypothetical protein